MNLRDKAIPRLVGSSAVLSALRQEIETAARSDAKVLITGESGSGKEIVSQMIHAGSRRHRAPMMAVNCAAMAETLLETELFGHARGSFTGAYRDRAGIFEAAHGGTVFLDEIGETSPRMQGMLLRFLESGEVQRVGADRPQARVDVRVIAATHRHLMDGVNDKSFRADLYYRLNIIQIHVAPLREHLADVPELVQYWLDQFRDPYQGHSPVIAADAMRALSAYSWPGNVRELRNVLERLVSRGYTRPITAADLPREVTSRGTEPAPSVTVHAAETRADSLFARLVSSGESFWSAVYEPFILRDLTRDDLRTIVGRGLTQTCGSYRLLVELFNMPERDYKRFLTFLRKHGCHMPFQQFRTPAPLRALPDHLAPPDAAPPHAARPHAARPHAARPPATVSL